MPAIEIFSHGVVMTAQSDHTKSYRSESLRIVENYYAFGFSYLLDAESYLRTFSTKYSIGGAPLVPMAQQGSIICFVALLVIYARSMNNLDQKHGFDEEEEN